MKVVRPDINGLCSADIYPLSVKKSVLLRDFLYYILLSKNFTEYAISGSGRAGMPKVNRKHLFQFRTCMPSLKEQEYIVIKLDELFDQIQKLRTIYQQKLEQLDELKQSILHQAFTGRL